MKKNNIILSFVVMIMLIIITCNIVRDNPLDEMSDHYILPTIVVDSQHSSVQNNDTIHFDTATIVLLQDSYNREFKFKLSDSSWSDWSNVAQLHMSGLKDTLYTVTIATRYKGGEKAEFYDMSFCVIINGYQPVFNEELDTIIKVQQGNQLFLKCSLSCIEPVVFQWFKSDSALVNKTDSFLTIVSVNTHDSGNYYCVASNQFGEASSRHFKVSVDTSFTKRYRVYYLTNKADNGTAPSDDHLYAKDSTFSLLGNIGNLSKNGYTFAGWMKIDGEDISYYSAGKKLQIGTADVFLYAWWTTANVYTITYNHNNSTSGVVPTDRNNYVEGAAATVFSNTGALEKTGYVFGWWCRDSLQQGKRYKAGDTIIFGSKNLHLYAAWDTIPRVKITYNAPTAERGTVPNDNNLYQKGDVVYVKGNSGNLEKTGYSFTGWSFSENENAKTYKADDTIISSQSAVDLFARWSSLSTFKITYDRNNAESGIVPVDENNYLSGTNATIKANTGNLQKSGYTFFGWNLQADGLGVTFKSDATIKVDSKNITLYAMWTTKQSYSITYVVDSSVSGIIPEDKNHYIEGDSVTILGAATVNKNGYTFTNWNTKADGSGITLKAGSKSVFSTTDVTLYAQWKINQYEIIYISSSTTYHKDTINHGGLLTVPPQPTRDGFTFSGWFKDPEFSAKWDFSTAAATKSISLYAAWTSTFYTVTFFTGTETTLPSQTVQRGGKISAPIPAPTRTGYELSAWYKDSSLLVMWNFGADTVVSNVPLFAKWTKAKYDVTFSYQNGKVDSVSSVTHGDTVIKPVQTPIKDGYTFDNWYPPRSGGIPWNFATTVTAPCTLYAQWTLNRYQVTLNARNGSTATSVTVNHGNLVTKPANPTRDGYDFDKWYAELSCTTPWNFNSPVTQPCTLYAQWTIKRYLIVFNSMGGSAISSVYINHGSTVNRPDSVPKFEGYLFDNWYKEASGTTLWNFAADTIKVPDTIFAKWVEDSTIIAWGKVENPTAKCRLSGTMPEYEALVANSKLPDPFMKLNGTRITNKSDWACRREEIRQQLLKYVFGDKPIPAKGSVTGTVTTSKITVNVNEGGKSCSFEVTVDMNGATQPAPSIISYGSMGGASAPNGVAKITFTAIETTGGSGAKTGPFYTFYGSTHPAGYLVAQAWQISRIIDVMELNPGIFDPYRVGVTGCSHYGKGAFVAGTLDNRIALTIPCESGIGGTVALRLVEQLDQSGEWPYHAITYVRWLSEVALGKFTTANSAIGDNTDRLPVDMHSAMALIAPRAIYIVDNASTSYAGLDKNSSYVTGMVGKEIFKALGVGDNFAYECASGEYCSWRSQYNTSLNAMIDKFLLNKTSTTGAFNSDLSTKPNPLNFYDWSASELPGSF